MSASEDWSIPPWQVESDCTGYWWSRYVVYKNELHAVDEANARKAKRKRPGKSGGFR